MVCGRNDMHAEVLKSTSPLENQSDVLGAKIYFTRCTPKHALLSLGECYPSLVTSRVDLLWLNIDRECSMMRHELRNHS